MSIPNLIQNVNRRIENAALMTTIVRQMEPIKTCCFFFDLKMGCKLIFLFETVCSLWQIYFAGKQIIIKKDTTLAPIWIDTPIIPQHGVEFDFFIGLFGFFSAQLLITGAIFERKICVLLWVYGTVLLTLIYMFTTLVIDCIPDLMLYDVLKVGAHAYFILIAFAYYAQMKRAQGTNDDLQVLFATSEA